jgi:hypothetical protein
MRNLLSILTVLAVATAAGAQGTLGVYFDTDRNSIAAQATPFELFDIYVILHDVDNSVAGADYRLTLPAGVFVSGVVYGGANPVAIDSPSQGTAVGLGSCELILNDLNVDSIVIATLSCMTLSEFGNQPISLGPYVNPQDLAAAPRYADCSNGLHEVAVQNATIMSSTVPLDGSSWGSVKSLFTE